jgi:hypothetical protein
VIRHDSQQGNNPRSRRSLSQKMFGALIGTSARIIDSRIQ